MREQAPDLEIKRADELPALGHRHAEQLLGGQAERVTSPSSSNTRRSTPCADGCWGPKLRVKLRRAFSAITASRQPSVQRRPLTGGSNYEASGQLPQEHAPQKRRSCWQGRAVDGHTVLQSTPWALRQAMPLAAVRRSACLMPAQEITPSHRATRISASIQA